MPNSLKDCARVFGMFGEVAQIDLTRLRTTGWACSLLRASRLDVLFQEICVSVSSKSELPLRCKTTWTSVDSLGGASAGLDLPPRKGNPAGSSSGL